MKTVILEVASLDDSLAAFSHAWKAGKVESQARISFATPELLWAVLTAKRWQLLKVLAGDNRPRRGFHRVTDKSSHRPASERLVVHRRPGIASVAQGHESSRAARAAPTSPANKGCGLVGREVNSGCA